MPRTLGFDETPDDVTPTCPHCEGPIDRLHRRKVDDALGKAYVWSCPACARVLGVSHRKGFWMG